ncbi:Hypothetical predicted protein [Mytilus galloprovincialis]|uniref:CCHC-type domain-containing protein n=1 Tax=Mytilus galloprovincialis TaxID=29158 RepID=A0A8B6HHX4_MYTGA|nr:Hypothetical predicted protein [Mytilus galloprovincialis]
MALEGAPVSTWKVELEQSNKKFENKLGQVHEKLDNMMDQFKQLLTSPFSGSRSPGRQTGTDSCHHCGERGHSKMECPNLRGKSVSGSAFTDRGPPWEGVCYHCLKLEHVRKDCLDFQGRDKTVPFMNQSRRTATGPLNLNGTTQEAGVDVDRRFTVIKDSDSGCWKIRANQGYSLMVDTPVIPLVEKCEVPQGNLVTAALLTGDKEGSVANIMRKPIGAILAVENHSSIQKVAATTETTLASDEEAKKSWDSTSDSEAHTTLVEGASDEKIVTVFPTPVVDGGMTDNTENSPYITHF